MTFRAQINRYLHIFEKIQNGYPTREEIIDHLRESGFKTSEKTFRRDIDALRNEFGIGVTYSREKEGYFVDEENDSTSDNFIRLMKMVSATDIIVSSLKGGKKMLNYISFDAAGDLQGIDQLQQILRSIEQSTVLEFKHQRFNSDNVKKYRIHPYLLKEYQNRWYVIGELQEKGELRTFGIDRMSESMSTTKKFKRKKDFDPRELFSRTIGLTYMENEPCPVELSFTPFQGNYIKSLPLHSSQETLIDDDNEFRVRLYIEPNHELKQRILMYGENVKVLEPSWLAEDIRNSLRKTLENY